MNKNLWIFATTIAMAVTLWQGCIHEYPKITPIGPGENPSTVQGFIELNYDLKWDHLLRTIDFNTKTSTASGHRFIVEVRKEGEVVVHDTEYIDDTEFSTGKFRRKLSVPLEPKEYTIAAWYDRNNTTDEPYFNAEDLSNVVINNTSTIDTLAFQCGYASSLLDLREFADEKSTVVAVKELDMHIPGARVRIVATDVQDFITQQKEALNQGDKFTMHMDFSSGAYDSFNIFNNNVFQSEKPLSLSGWMRLPFADYTELTIGEGFLFCRNEEDEAHMKLSITNSALVTVSKTEVFSFPVKKGYITVVKVDFLTHPLEGIFSVDHIWEGEIYYDY